MKDAFTRAMRKEGWSSCRCKNCKTGHNGPDMRRAHRRARARMRAELRSGLGSGAFE